MYINEVCNYNFAHYPVRIILLDVQSSFYIQHFMDMKQVLEGNIILRNATPYRRKMTTLSYSLQSEKKVNEDHTPAMSCVPSVNMGASCWLRSMSKLCWNCANWVSQPESTKMNKNEILCK